MPDLFPLIAAERRATADFLEGLSDEQASVDSLCRGWQVRHVAAHLTMPFAVSTPQMVLGMVKRLGNFNRLSDDFAKATAAQPVAALAATLRSNAEHRFTPPGGMGSRAPLTDIVVHTLDMRVPLGIPEPGPAPQALDEILGFLMTRAATRGFLPKDRVPGLRYVSDDTGWTAGDGPLVSGPAASLVLAITGRPAGLDGLRGDGLEVLRRRLPAA
jgi:uncharacterized protein (TIGR03083 family)